MGKISSGCDIAFTIGDVTVRMGSELSYEQSSLEEIVKTLLSNEDMRSKLYTLLKYETLVKEITPEMVTDKGVVANNTVASLVKLYPGLDWNGVDLSTKLFTANWFKYLDKDLTSSIIVQYNPTTNVKEKIMIVNPNDILEVRRLNEYLRVRNLIRTLNEETQTIIDNSDLGVILKTLLEEYDLDLIDAEYKKLVEKYGAYQTKEHKKHLEEFTKNRNKRLLAMNLHSEKVKTARDLLEFYLGYENNFVGKLYKKGSSSMSMNTELNRVVKLLQGYDTTVSNYLDVFANEVVLYSKWDYKHNCAKISREHFLGILSTKLANLELNKTDDNALLRRKLNTYINADSHSVKDILEIVNLLIDLADDEFSYSLNSVDNNYIYLNNVPRTLGERFKDFTYKSVLLLKPVESYKGHTIYLGPEGKFYFSRHPVTEATYGNRYSSSLDCRQKIDNKVEYNSISKDSLIEFKTKKEDVVFVPNRLIKGLVIKSLNIHFNLNLQLNALELALLYDNLLEDNNTLNKFYDYITDIVETKNKDRIRNILIKKIDTSEKAACFIYALNELEGTDRVPITSKVFDSIVERIDSAKNDYEYYLVEEVSDAINANLRGLKVYRNISKEGSSRRPVYKVLLTKINPTEIHNDKVKYDQVGRPLASTRLLKDLAEKMQNKLGITIHVESQSDLEQMFELWGLEMPSDTHGFVRNGEIYINMSNASEKDLFHEYTHIMLGILKAKNFDNYYKLVEILANTKYGDSVKKKLKNNYPYLADSDLNEEVFAELLGNYLAGKDMDAFLNNLLSIQKLAVDDKLTSIFGTQPISSEFYLATWGDIFKLFSYDLGVLMNEDNGLHISSEGTYREATNWIASLIREYAKEGSNVGIYENCD